jgi:hypothetical protein
MRWVALLNEKRDGSTVTLLNAANRVPACPACRGRYSPIGGAFECSRKLAYFCCNSMHAVRFVCSLEARQRPCEGDGFLGFELGKEQIYWSRTWRLMALLDEELRSGSQAYKCLSGANPSP